MIFCFVGCQKDDVVRNSTHYINRVVSGCIFAITYTTAYLRYGRIICHVLQAIASRPI